MDNSTERSFELSLEEAVAEGQIWRAALSRRRQRQSWIISVGVTLVWLVWVAITENWERVASHWLSALTMVAGSFVAGATPQGGGAVAFPVFTKVLGVSTEAARSFSLLIQAVGMGSAAISIALSHRSVAWRAALTGGLVGSVAFVATLLVFGDSTKPFWPMDLPSPYVKVTFTIVVVGMAWVVFLGSRIPIRVVSDQLPPMNGRLWVALIVAGVLGGVASALVGSGADVLIYLFVVVLFGIRAGVGVPTSVVSMAIVSLTGFVVLGFVDGQLNVELNDAGLVSSIGGHNFSSALDKSEADLFGMWLAAVPIVTWGAPLGARIASRLSSQTFVQVVVGLAVLEAGSTLMFLDDLHTDPQLMAYGAVGLAVALFGLTSLAANRLRLLGLPSQSWSTLITRSSAETTTDYNEKVL